MNEIKKPFPKEIHAVDYAGYIELQDGPYYEDNKILNIDENLDYEFMGQEIVKRYNSHDSLKERVKELTQLGEELLKYVKVSESLNESYAIGELRKKAESLLNKTGK
jgi:hypothetical protein